MSDKIMIAARIDVTKVPKERLFKGAKGTYLNVILIETPNGQYGDFMVKLESTKEEREQRVQLPILGNAKYLGRKTAQNASAPTNAPVDGNAAPAPEDDVPF